METGELFAAVFVFGMLAGVFVIVMAMRQRSQQLEMLHRERMAMIDPGQVPIDPPAIARLTSGGRAGAGPRSMSLGIIIIAAGMGLMSIVSLAGGAPEPASVSAVPSSFLALPLSPTVWSAGARFRTPHPPRSQTNAVAASEPNTSLSRLHTTIKRCRLSDR